MLTLQTKKVSNMTKKGKHTVLFICLGNICRSPAAEGIMKSLVEKAGLQDEFEIDSAGIGSWHVGQLPDSRMRKCGAEHGYNFNSHARQFQKSDFARFETIVVRTTKTTVPLPPWLLQSLIGKKWCAWPIF